MWLVQKTGAEVFSQQAWKDYAAKKLVLVELDFPKSFQLPEETKKQNDKLAQKFKIQGYPTIVITTPAEPEGRIGLCGGRSRSVYQGARKSALVARGVRDWTT